MGDTEDELRNHAGHLRTYAASLGGTHDTIHGRVKALSSAYSSHSYELMAENGEAHTFFPDQPIELTFRRTSPGRVLVTTRVDDDDTRTASMEEATLVSALRQSGTAFFVKMKELLPENRDSYDNALRRLGTKRLPGS